MISFIKGITAYVDSEEMIIENNGIGYQVKVPSTLVEKVRVGQEVMLYTHFHLTENMLALYGFLTKEELKLFEKLIGITGVGPKSGLGMLSVLSVQELYYAIFSEDTKAISKAPGIGPKGAKRIVMELKDKLKMEDLAMPEEEGASYSDITPVSAGNSDSITDAIEALIALGYGNGEAYRAVHGVKGAADMDADRLLKEALKVILTFR